jgi:hypothetical protein
MKQQNSLLGRIPPADKESLTPLDAVVGRLILMYLREPSSILGHFARCVWPGGLVGLTKSVALELAERGIRVNAICPGGTATAIFSRVYPDLPPEWIEQTPEIVAPWIAAGTPLGRSGYPVDIANAALWLASSESSFVTGQALVVDGGLTVGRPWSVMLEANDRLKERFQSAMAETQAPAGKED